MRTILLCLIILCSSALMAQPVIKFEKSKQKFEKVEADTVLHFDFFFVNKGDEPLIISDVKVDCGCTVPSYPKEPILPGERKKLEVSFDTKGKIGWQYRNLEVISNAKNSPTIIKFNGFVETEKQ